MLPHTDIICTHPCEHRYVKETIHKMQNDYIKTVMLICGRCGKLLEAAETEVYVTEKGNKPDAT